LIESIAKPTLNGRATQHSPQVAANPLCFVHPDAKIGANVTVSPFVTIAADVVVGDGTWIGPGAHLMDGARVGRNCKIFTGAIVGSPPQDLKYKGEKTTLEIGDNTIIREYATLNIGTAGGGGRTVIGNSCLIMAYVHVAHDCFIGDNVILANNVTLAGHIEIGNFAVIGGMTAVHQFVKIGEHTMIGGGSLVSTDVPPYVTAARTPLSYAGVNKTGLRRRGFSVEQIQIINDIYRTLFVHNSNVSKGLEVIKTDTSQSLERDKIFEFIERGSKRGLIKGFLSKIKKGE
jgi:UDP-N-acetylglucosamine acyltransferase